MNKHINSISGRLSLRPPQRRSLEILARIAEIVPPQKNVDLENALAIIKSEFPSVLDFEREFPSLCFALATGVGKTRLMGAFISYLHLAHGIQNFFVLAPNLTIYNKLITDFTPNTSKYVFKGIAEFAVNPPNLINGDNYDQAHDTLFGGVRINIFNISKINSEVRGGKMPRIKRLSEYIGQSYFDYLASLSDLALIMDESHRYRASAGVKAINELKPVIGLELTATPLIETSKGAIPFKNVIYDYPLGVAMADGFVKEPAVVTRKDFNPAKMSVEEIERLKLEDGVRLHESVKVELETYAREMGLPIIKPFVLIIARETTHASQLMQLIQSDAFFEGRYKTKIIQVDSSKSGAEEDEMVERLLKVERTDEPTEIVIHVNMLKEGWDVTNLYTIIPLRAANARTLIEQSIGRGLRLPYGKRTGVTSVDRLNIIAHDKFQEIIEEANKPGSAIHLQQVVLNGDQLQEKTETVISQSNLAKNLGLPSQSTPTSQLPTESSHQSLFTNKEDLKISQITFEAIKQLENQPQKAPSIDSLYAANLQKEIIQLVTEEYQPFQTELEGLRPSIDIANVVQKTIEYAVQQTINIPRIIVVPKTQVKSGFKSFKLDLRSLTYSAPSEDLWIQHLRTNQLEILGVGRGGVEEKRLEDYIVSGLVDFNDIAYDDHADLLFDLASQTVTHFKNYLPEDEMRKVLRVYQKDIARFIHSQMQNHYWEEAVDYETHISKGFSELKECAYTKSVNEAILDYHISPSDKSNMAKYLFGGFKHCLYPMQKFHSDAERKMSVILERESIKWFKPAKGQFQITYKWGVDHHEYQPDFVAETSECIYMLEPKASNQMMDGEVLAKQAAAVKWCKLASEHAQTCNGKQWIYLLIPHDAIAENMTLMGLKQHFGAK